MRKLTLYFLIAVALLTHGFAAAQARQSINQTAKQTAGNGCATNPCVTTFHYNNQRTGVNQQETMLVANNFPSTLSADTVPVDGLVYAQPLYVYGVAWGGSANCPAGTLNMVYVATENNTLYAILADAPYTVCQSVSMNLSGTNADTAMPVTALPLAGNPPLPCANIPNTPEYGTIGITGTPVIDTTHNLLFVASAHQGGTSPTYTYTQRLTAVDITTLSIVNAVDIPTYVNAAKPAGYPTFYTQNESQRPGLMLETGKSGAAIYIGWGSFCDSYISSLGGAFGLVSQFHWNYATSKFAPATSNFYTQGAFTNATSPKGEPAGVWMSGGAPAGDAAGNIFVAVGNGFFQGVTPPLAFGNSMVKLGGTPFGELDYYTPNVWEQLNDGASNVSCNPYPGGSCPSFTLPDGDWDLGSGGIVILTDSSKTQYGEVIAAGKEGMFYVTFYCASATLCPSSNWNQVMGGLDGLASAGQGGYNTNTPSLYSSYACTPVATAMTPSPGNLAQCFYGVPVHAERAESGQRATPAFWPNSTPYLYVVGTTDIVKAFAYNPTTGTFASSPSATANPPAVAGPNFGYPGASPAISSNGTNFSSAVLWVLDTSSYNSKTNNQAVLTAYAAQPNGATLTQLWTNGTTSGPGAVKFQVPTVANGKVYIGGARIGGCNSAGCTGLLTIFHP
jgi:hypothetical protein